MVPWVEFTNFNINVFDDGKFLLPIFTMGKFFERDGKRLLPLAIQVHHAVCDGYHIGVFVEKLQTYIEPGKFALIDKPKPIILDPQDAVVRVTLGSICTSDLHIKHGSVPRAVPGITVGHEMVGVVEEVGSAVTTVKPGDRVTVNAETFCGECFFCRHGFVNNCTDPNGGWALGCRIDGG